MILYNKEKLTANQFAKCLLFNAILSHVEFWEEDPLVIEHFEGMTNSEITKINKSIDKQISRIGKLLRMER